MQRELTLRALILGSLITTVFTAANVYLGLKVGLTFASSIPAAVISMAILSLVKDSSILENNIVQTVASAAGTLSAIIFVLPGLVIVGWWSGFPFWSCLSSVCACSARGPIRSGRAAMATMASRCRRMEAPRGSVKGRDLRTALFAPHSDPLVPRGSPPGPIWVRIGSP